MDRKNDDENRSNCSNSSSNCDVDDFMSSRPYLSSPGLYMGAGMVRRVSHTVFLQNIANFLLYGLLKRFRQVIL